MQDLTRTQRERLAAQAVRQVVRALQLPPLRVEVSYRDDQDNLGTNGTELEYERVAININVSDHKTAADLQRTVIHELVHVVVAPMVDVAQDLASADDFQQKQIRRATERTVSALERALHPLIFPPD